MVRYCSHALIDLYLIWGRMASVPVPYPHRKMKVFASLWEKNVFSENMKLTGRTTLRLTAVPRSSPAACRCPAPTPEPVFDAAEVLEHRHRPARELEAD